MFEETRESSKIVRFGMVVSSYLASFNVVSRPDRKDRGLGLRFIRIKSTLVVYHKFLYKTVDCGAPLHYRATFTSRAKWRYIESKMLSSRLSNSCRT